MQENGNQPKTIVSAFVEKINEKDIDGLAALMNENHQFIDDEDEVMEGKTKCLASWTVFFQLFPDFRNEVEYFKVKGELVVMAGNSVCSEPSLSGPAIWTARVDGDKVSEWRVHTDSKTNRRKLGIPGSAGISQ